MDMMMRFAPRLPSNHLEEFVACVKKKKKKKKTGQDDLKEGNERECDLFLAWCWGKGCAIFRLGILVINFLVAMYLTRQFL